MLLSESSKVKRILVTTNKGLFGRTLSGFILKPGCSQNEILFFDGYIDSESDSNPFEEIIESFRPEIIIHNAVKLPRGGDIHNWSLKERNLGVFELILDAAEKFRVRNVLAFTSYHVFSKALQAPFKLNELNLEGTKLESWYSSYKIEEIRFASAHNQKKSITKVNFIMLPHMFGVYDNFEEGKRHFVADVIVKISEAKNLHQSTVSFKGDGRQKLQLASSESLVSFVLDDYLKRMATADFVEVFNGGACASLSDVTNFVADALNYQGRVVFDIAADKRHARNMYFRELNTLVEIQEFHISLKKVVDEYTRATVK